MVHLAYYGFSCISLFTLWATPDREHIITVAVILLLIIDRISRSILMPGYPFHYEICRIYKLEAASGKWLPHSVPESQNGEADSLVMTDSVPESQSTFTMFNKMAVALSVYEIMNVHISSSLRLVVCVGWLQICLWDIVECLMPVLLQMSLLVCQF